MSKIAINAIFFQPRGGGIKEYIYNLLHSLVEINPVHEFVVYVLENEMDFAKQTLPQDFRYKAIPYHSGSLINTIRRSLFAEQFWRKEEDEEKWDLFHSPFFHCPKLRHTPIVMTVHDMRFYRFPSTYTFVRYLFLKRAVKQSVQRASHIISISDFTKSELLDAYSLTTEKITVIHEAINPQRFTNKNIKEKIGEKYSALVKGRFMLTVGHLEPRKNYDRLIMAFRLLKEQSEFEDVKLVIVGKKGHRYESTIKLIQETKDMVYLNFVEHEDLIWLYKNAILFVFPSIYEGFGFPPLEAGMFGVVSAVSDVSSIPEVCGDGAFYFNPNSVKNIFSVLQEALTDKHKYKKKCEAMKKRLSELSWTQNAKETLRIYKSILENH